MFFFSFELQASCNKFGQLTIGYLDLNFAYTQKINWYICSLVYLLNGKSNYINWYKIVQNGKNVLILHNLSKKTPTSVDVNLCKNAQLL